jgi:ATP-dependent Zn protease
MEPVITVPLSVYNELFEKSAGLQLPGTAIAQRSLNYEALAIVISIFATTIPLLIVYFVRRYLTSETTSCPIEKYLVKNFNGYERIEETEDEEIKEFDEHIQNLIKAIKQLDDTATFERACTAINSLDFFTLYGPPGTGKTRTVHRIAELTGCQLYCISPSEFEGIYVGVATQRVTNFFSELRKKIIGSKKPILLFLEELSSAAGRRNNEFLTSNSKNDVVNRLLIELDILNNIKMDEKQARIFVAASTNFVNTNFMDGALLRNCRLGKLIEIGFPTDKQLLRVLELLIKKQFKKLAPRDRQIFSSEDYTDMIKVFGKERTFADIGAGIKSTHADFSINPEKYPQNSEKLFPAIKDKIIKEFRAIQQNTLNKTNKQ